MKGSDYLHNMSEESRAKATGESALAIGGLLAHLSNSTPDADHRGWHQPIQTIHTLQLRRSETHALDEVKILKSFDG